MDNEFAKVRKQLVAIGEELVGEACLDPIGIAEVLAHYAKAMESINLLQDSYKSFRSHL